VSDVRDLLRTAKLVVSPETFNVVSLNHEGWMSMLSNPEMSPRADSEFLIFKDKWEVTLVVNDRDLQGMSGGLLEAKIEKGYRLLTFDADLDFDTVGFIAEVSRILAEQEISILPMASFCRDHVLLKQGDLARALKAFSGVVEEVC